jgi:hypothetical protein
MIRINPDPHTGGYVYVPTRAVTAFFPADGQPRGAAEALSEAGFADDQIDVFTGDDGAKLMDLDGRRHGLWVRFMRSLEEIFAEDADVFRRAEQTLRTGGSVVAVFSGGKADKKRRAAEILKAHGGREVIYWGRLATEYL